MVRQWKTTAAILLLAFALGLPLGMQGCAKSNPTGPSVGCSDCGSGNVYWDTSADRCRDRSNGQFVKSCCCGH